MSHLPHLKEKLNCLCVSAREHTLARDCARLSTHYVRNRSEVGTWDTPSNGAACDRVPPCFRVGQVGHKQKSAPHAARFRRIN
ncbi:hypothetical protein TUM20249_54410 [Pseudomonas tohonis]|nr:hypothetical protein TUM20249_54410 [Pseudomonas tohonis]